MKNKATWWTDKHEEEAKKEKNTNQLNKHEEVKEKERIYIFINLSYYISINLMIK